jgi:two-component system chemotaxis sensor kinase CheA
MAGAKTPSAADSTIRVDVGLLDKLMNLVGELVLARNQILQFNARHEDAALNANSQRLNVITTELQESVMKTRMQPIGVVWNKLPRLVRYVAASCQKRIALEMDGADTGIDRTILEAIKDPLTHMVRNYCDHGIEMPPERERLGKPAVGRLSLRAYHEGGHVNIEIVDDGAGIDPERIKAKAVQKGLIRQEQAERLSDREAIQLVFLPGFSTAEKVTSISGRGVGMDVVKTNIEKIGGVVDLASTPGQGTAVKIKIPLTLAIIPGLVVHSGGERFVIPQVGLLELVRLEGESGLRQIERVQGSPVYRRRGMLLPIAYLNGILGLKPEDSAAYLQMEVNRGLPAKFLVRYFDRVGLDWQVKPEVRRLARFEKRDLRDDLRGLGPYDVVFCRNVPIYFDIETKKKILAGIRGCMSPDAYLSLGAAETTFGLDDKLLRKPLSGAVFYQRGE